MKKGYDIFLVLTLFIFISIGFVLASSVYSDSTPTIPYYGDKHYDSDNGKNINVKGATMQVGSDIKATDVCIGVLYVNEYYVTSDDVIASEKIECPTGTNCNDGACKAGLSSETPGLLNRFINFLRRLF